MIYLTKPREIHENFIDAYFHFCIICNKISKFYYFIIEGLKWFYIMEIREGCLWTLLMHIAGAHC